MTTDTHRENACPGALMRRRQTWPPLIVTHGNERPCFSAPRPWVPQRWQRAFVHVEYARFSVHEA